MAYIRSRAFHIWSNGAHLGLKKSTKRKDLPFIVNDEWFHIPESVINEFVVMRYEDLKAKNNLKRTEKRALKNNYGNFGCDYLAKKYGRPSVSERLLKKNNK